MLAHLAFWLIVAAIWAFFYFTTPRQRFVWGRRAAGAGLILMFCTLGVDVAKALFR